MKYFVISSSVPICPECSAGMSRRGFYTVKTGHQDTLYICNDGPHMYSVVGPGQAENELKVKRITVRDIGL